MKSGPDIELRVDFEFTVTINRAVAEVYDFFWSLDERDFSKSTVVPVYERMDEGPRRVGSRVREVVNAGLFQMEIISEITGYEPGERLEYRFEGGGIRGELTYLFGAVEGGTLLTQKVSITFTGILRVLNPLLPVTYGRRAAERLRIVKEMLESGG